MAERAAGVDASIPLQIKRPDMVGRISDLLNMQRSATALQAERTALQGAQQTQRQRSALASFDVAKIIGDDGTIDLNKIPGSGLREAAGDQFPEVLSQYAGIKQQQLAAKQSLVQLTDAQRNSFGEIMGALRSDPEVAQDTPAGRQKVVQAFGQYAQMYGNDVENVLRAYAGPIQNAPPGKMGQVLQNIQLQATSASEQASRQAPQYQSTGAELRNLNPYAQSGQAPQSIPLTLPPGDQETIVTDQIGNQYVMRRDRSGNIVATRPLSGGSGTGAPSGPARFEPGELPTLLDQAESNARNVDATREAARTAPQQLDQINKAMEISQGVSTGGGDLARTRAKWESAVASVIPGFDIVKDDATKLQLLDKYLERIAADSARVLGASASTDAARESIARQNATPGYTRDAVQSVLKYAKAQTMAMAGKADAQEKWLDGNKIIDAHKFETQWRKAYDPRVFEMLSMSDAERKEYLKKLSPDDRKKLSANTQQLIDIGAIE